MSATRYAIEKLRDGNYESWRKAIWAILLAEQLFEHATGSALSSTYSTPTEFDRAEQKCLSILVQTIDYSQFGQVRETDTPNLLWKRLEEAHRPQGFSTRFELRRLFFNMRLREGETMTQWISRVESMVDRLRGIGGTVPEEDIIVVLANGLPEVYSTVVVTLDSIPDKMLTLDYVKRRLLNEYMRQEGPPGLTEEEQGERLEYSKRPEPARALAARSQVRPSRAFRGGAPAPSHRRPAVAPPRMTSKETDCFRCGRSGHMAADCRIILEGDHYADDVPDTPRVDAKGRGFATMAIGNDSGDDNDEEYDPSRPVEYAF